jgi:hypothetical protein
MVLEEPYFVWSSYRQDIESSGKERVDAKQERSEASHEDKNLLKRSLTESKDNDRKRVKIKRPSMTVM